ncbi:hypothetical protein GQX74_010216 [Glossina fuscipes]|nr:hypothetical protein GQX74_010216 [Glossina fuscipes]
MKSFLAVVVVTLALNLALASPVVCNMFNLLAAYYTRHRHIAGNFLHQVETHIFDIDYFTLPYRNAAALTFTLSPRTGTDMVGGRTTAVKKKESIYEGNLNLSFILQHSKKGDQYVLFLSRDYYIMYVNSNILREQGWSSISKVVLLKVSEESSVIFYN